MGEGADEEKNEGCLELLSFALWVGGGLAEGALFQFFEFGKAADLCRPLSKQEPEPHTPLKLFVKQLGTTKQPD